MHSLNESDRYMIVSLASNQAPPPPRAIMGRAGLQARGYVYSNIWFLLIANMHVPLPPE